MDNNPNNALFPNAWIWIELALFMYFFVHPSPNNKLKEDIVRFLWVGQSHN
jgi:hypothetical protein